MRGRIAAETSPTGGPWRLHRRSPPDERRFFFFGKFEITPRNLSVMVANLSDQDAVSKLQILFCTGAILLRSEVARRSSSRFSPFRLANILVLPLPTALPLKLSGLSPDPYSVHENAGLISKARGFRQPIESTST